MSRHPARGPGHAATITGTIQPCAGRALPPGASPPPQSSAAAAVRLLRGNREQWKPIGHGTWQLVFPSTVVAWEQVRKNQPFRFGHLSPGGYVVWAQYAGGNATTYRNVSVAAGEALTVELPNDCV